MSIPRGVILATISIPCGLSKQEVLNWRENGLPAVFGGRCQNLYADDEGVEHICGIPVGSHPYETAGAGKNYLLDSALNPVNTVITSIIFIL
jgi:hypothetical protein